MYLYKICLNNLTEKKINFLELYRGKSKSTSKDHCKNIDTGGKTELQFKFKKINILGLWYECKHHPVNLSHNVCYLDAKTLFIIKNVIFQRPCGTAQNPKLGSCKQSGILPSYIQNARHAFLRPVLQQ